MVSSRLGERRQSSVASAHAPGEIICILGMHRSGTSCLAGCLQEACLEMGNVVESAPHNRKGNRENREIRALNGKVLEYSEGAWDRPPAKLRWNREHQRRRDEIISGYDAAKRWGFKDPRSTLTIAFWREAIPDMQLVGTFRHPMAVVRSLAARNHTPAHEALELWRTYNERMLECYREHPFPILSFDLPFEEYRMLVRDTIRELGLRIDRDGPHFLESALINQVVEDDDIVPDDVVLLYRELQTACQSRSN